MYGLIRKFKRWLGVGAPARYYFSPDFLTVEIVRTLMDNCNKTRFLQFNGETAWLMLADSNGIITVATPCEIGRKMVLDAKDCFPEVWTVAERIFLEHMEKWIKRSCATLKFELFNRRRPEDVGYIVMAVGRDGLEMFEKEEWYDKFLRLVMF